MIELPSVYFVANEPDVPKFSGQIQLRLSLEVRQVQSALAAKLCPEVRRLVDEFQQGKLIVAAAPDRLLPFFESYSRSLYAVCSDACISTVDDPGKLRRILRWTLPWSIAIHIVPLSGLREGELNDLTFPMNSRNGSWSWAMNRCTRSLGGIDAATRRMLSLLDPAFPSVASANRIAEATTVAEQIHDSTLLEAMQRLEESDRLIADDEGRVVPVDSRPQGPAQLKQLKTFSDLTWVFTSDHAVQIAFPGYGGGVHPYAELGFEGGRNRKPIKAWHTLLLIARKSGRMRRDEVSLVNAAAFEKAVGKVRENLRKLFGLKDDPSPWVREDKAYRAAFHIETSDFARE